MAGSLGASTLNLALLVGVLAYYLKDPVKGFVASRRTNLKAEVDSVATQLQVSRQRFEEFSARLEALDQEITTLRAQVQEDAIQTQGRIQAEARRLAEELIEDAKSSSANTFSSFQHQLRVELAEKILDRVENILEQRLTGEERTRIRRDFSRQMEKSV